MPPIRLSGTLTRKSRNSQGSHDRSGPLNHCGKPRRRSQLARPTARFNMPVAQLVNQLWLDAIHESGHGIAAIALGCKCTLLAISGGGGRTTRPRTTAAVHLFTPRADDNLAASRFRPKLRGLGSAARRRQRAAQRRASSSRVVCGARRAARSMGRALFLDGRTCATSCR